METSTVTIHCSQNKSIIVISAYSPGHNNISFINELNNLFNQLEINNPNTFYLIAADLNCRLKEWGDTASNTRGQYLQNWLNNHSIDLRATLYTTDEPNFLSSKSFLDICIADARLHLDQLNNNKLTTTDYDSDHRAIKINLQLNTDDNFNYLLNDIKQNKMYKKTKWCKFRNTLNKINREEIPMDRNLSNNEIEEHLKRMDEYIIKAIEETVPTSKPSNSMLRYVNKKNLKTIQNKILTSIKKNITKISQALRSK